MPNHSGCFDCGGGHDEILYSVVADRRFRPDKPISRMSVALCAACFEKKEVKRGGR